MPAIPLTYEYLALLNDEEIIKTLKSIDARMERLETTGVKTFGNISQSSTKLGFSIGVTSGLVQALVHDLQRLAEDGVRAIKDITIESTELAAKLEAVQITFTNIFRGDQNTAIGFLKELRGWALDLGVQYTELSVLSRTLLPRSESIDQFQRLVETAVILERSDPDRTINDVRISLENAISRDYKSLWDRFDIPLSVITHIRQLAEEVGPVEALIIGLGDEFELTGRNLESFENTFSVALGKLQTRFEVLQTVYGTTLLDEFTESLINLNEFITTNQEALEGLAFTLATVLLEAIQAVTGEFEKLTDSINSDDITSFSQSLYNTVAGFTAFISEVRKLNEAVGKLNNFIFWGSLALDQQAKSTETAAQGWARWIGSIASATEFIDGLIKSIEGVVGLAVQGTRALILIGRVASNTIDYAEANQEITDILIESSKAQTRVEKGYEMMSNTEQAAKRATDAYLNTVKDFTKTYDDFIEKQREANEGWEEEADAVLEAADAAKKYAEAQTAAEEASDKVAKAQQKLTDAHGKALIDIGKRTVRALDDLELKDAERRIDALIKRTRSFEDIDIDRERKAADIATDTNRDYLDLERKRQDQLQEEAKDNAEDLLDIEEDFRNRLREIQLKFNQDAEDAERERSFLAFQEAVRNREKSIELAKLHRDDDIKDANKTFARRQADIQDNYEKELEDIRIGEQQKIEDLALWYDRQREDTLKQYDQDLQDIAQKYLREKDEINRSQQERIDDENADWEFRKDQLNKQYADELAIIANFEKMKTDLIREEAATRQKIRNAERYGAPWAVYTPLPTPTTKIPPSPGSSSVYLPTVLKKTFDDGGIVPGPLGSPQRITAHGGELILPTHKMGRVGNVTSFTVNPGITVHDPSQLTARQLAAVRALISDSMMDVFRRAQGGF